MSLSHSLFQVLPGLENEDFSSNCKEATRFSEGFKGTERQTKESGIINKCLTSVVTLVFELSVFIGEWERQKERENR